MLPDGSTDIVEINDLDINTGAGSFRFPAEGISHYLETIEREHGVVVAKNSFEISIVVTNKDTRWSIELDPRKGTGTYFTQFTKPIYPPFKLLRREETKK